jgi:2-oxo-4-hydroxy-4-carboxy-5-ureidoimidazoline decarboxylase
MGDLLRVADEIWWTLDAADWLEAFAHHPRIGERESAAPQSERASSWSSGEQAVVATATASARNELAAINVAYEARFGFIYIVCAAGRSAAELLAMAHARLRNNPELELRVAAGEQSKITSLRLRKLIMESE